jgi:Leucine-rich repeat (LRR) protein
LPIVLVYGIYSFQDLKEDKEREETGQFTNVRRAMKNPDKVTSIDLSYSYPRHTKFPIEILGLPNLRQIDLNEQMIEIIPAEIVKAKRLEVLNLLDNNIKEIPQLICNCSNLKELRVGGHIKEFPECLKRMKSLTHLSIQSNTVNDLMDELRNFENLETAHFYLKDGILDREKLRQIEIETGIKHKY